MNKKTLRLYKFRDADCPADESLCDAKIVAEFDELEMLGLVRIEMRSEEENYFDVLGKPTAYVDANGHYVSYGDVLSRLIKPIVGMSIPNTSTAANGDTLMASGYARTTKTPFRPLRTPMCPT